MEDKNKDKFVGVPRAVSIELMINTIYEDLQEIKKILEDKL